MTKSGTALGVAKDLLAAIERADLAATRAVADGRFDPTVQQAGQASEVADQPPLVALSIGTIAGGLLLRSPALTRTGARMLLAHAIATGLKTVVKRSVDRTRPDVALVEGYRMAPGDSHEHDLSSFPSGHTAGAVAIAEAIAREAPTVALPARLFAASVSIIQVPRCKHYVSDVLVGAAIGVAGAAIANRLIDAVDGGFTSDS